LGTAKEIGYETGKTDYRPNDKNDLATFGNLSKSIFKGVLETDSLGECGWVQQEEINEERLDAPFLLNIVDRDKLHETFPNLTSLREVCRIDNLRKPPEPNNFYYYLEVPDISEATGAISNIRRLRGSEIGSSRFTFKGGDLLFTRINPRKNRVTIIPDEIAEGYVSTEVYNLHLLANSKILDNHVLRSLLQTPIVQRQIGRLGTGSSSSRARVQEDDFLNHVFIPIPSHEVQAEISLRMRKALSSYWKSSQLLLDAFCWAQGALGYEQSKDPMRQV
jgi:type I restriction enzyme M protein